MVAAPHKPRRCLLRFLLPSRLAPLDGLLGLQYPPPTPRPTGTAAQLERYSYHPSVIAPPYSMSNQQPTGFPWNSPAGKTPYFGAPSNVPAGGYANTAPGAAYNRGELEPRHQPHLSRPPLPRGVLRSPSLDLSTHPPTQGPRPWPHTFQLRRSRRPQRHPEPPTPLLRSEPPMPLLRSEPPTPLLRSEPPTPLFRSDALTPLLRSAPPTPPPLGPRHIRHTPPTPSIGLVTPPQRRGTPTSPRRPNFPPAPPAAISPHQRSHRWHLPLGPHRRAGTPHRHPTPHHRAPLGPQRLDAHRKRSTSPMFRPHPRRDRFTSPIRSTLPSWMRQASSPRNPSESYTGLSQI